MIFSCHFAYSEWCVLPPCGSSPSGSDSIILLLKRYFSGRGRVSLDAGKPSEELQEEFTDSCGQLRMQPVLVSYNNAYPPKAVSPMAEFCIAGRVLK